jgi:hypothetical protein
MLFKTNLSKLFFCLIALFLCSSAHGQVLTERLILQDNKDSLYLKATGEFDQEGNYSFRVQLDTLKYFITKNDTIGGFNSIRHIGGNGGEIDYSSNDWRKKEEPFYYKNGLGTKLYGTAIGHVDDYETSNTRENISFISTTDDSVYYHLNGRLKAVTRKDPKAYYGTKGDWAAFSENGNVIYSIPDDTLVKLYVNDQLIDSTEFRFIQMAINNNGDYIYAKGHRPDKPIGKYDYMFYVHTNSRKFDYVRTVWDYKLKDNGAYYYKGDDNGTWYILINDKLYKKLDYVGRITIIDKANFFFIFGENGQKKINVNGKVYAYGIDDIIKPTLDKQGNFSCYTIIDYYLYKIINGKKIETPISKYGVRGVPIYISPTGSSLHYFRTEDSTYVYRDDELIFEPIANQVNFRIESEEYVVSSSFESRKISNGKILSYMEYDDKAYFIYNGKLSEPTIPKTPKRYANTNAIGNILVSNFNDFGFFTVQKIENKKFRINVNNTIYQELNGIDKIHNYAYFFTEKELVLYGIKNSAYYQFKLTW